MYNNQRTYNVAIDDCIIDIGYLLHSSVYDYIQSEKLKGVWPKKFKTEVLKAALTNRVIQQPAELILKSAPLK